MTRLTYLSFALKNFISESASCPACSSSTTLVRRKYGVTALRECPGCSLRFRTPRDRRESAERFYVDEVYKQGITTSTPTDAELGALLLGGFKDTEKDFLSRIAVLVSAGLKPGARILDFGSSLGYGSWQMRQAGFDVISFEIGRARSQYAKEKLGCTMIEDLRTVSGSIDCFFSCHVIEHLPDPNLLFEAAESALRPGGVFVCYCPNGSIEREREHGTDIYDRNWGMIHPLMVTPDFMRHETHKRKFSTCNVFSNPVDQDEVRGRRDGKLGGGELLAVAYLG